MKWQERISIDPKVLVGKPAIKGTRLSVEFIMEFLSNGWTEQQILASYPGITHDHILACLDYATEILKAERVFPLSV